MTLKNCCPVYPYTVPQLIDASTEHIVKSFVLFDKNINFTGGRDPCNPNLFILTQRDIYQSGSVGIKTLRLSENQINDLFYRLENLDQSNSLNRILYLSTM